jgi:hypothetical protein
MVDWSTVASIATAGGTLVLAIATFVSVRSANRSARVAEFAMQIGIRPLLMPSRLDDAHQKIMWADQHWARLVGGGAIVDVVGDNVYLAMSLRNSGSGIAVIHGWHLGLHDLHAGPHPHAEPQEFRPQSRDLYVPGGDIGFWQGAIRGRDDAEHAALFEAASAPRVFAIELLYTDHEGGQHTIGMFSVAPIGESRWLCSMVRHWNLDRPDPR